MRAFLCLLLIASPLLAEEQVVERGPNHNLIETIRTLELPGSDPILVTNRYVELGDGLNYLSNNQWVPAVPEFAIQNGMAVAAEGQNKITLPGNLNQAGAVKLVSADGREFRSTPLMLVLRDPDLGESVMLGVIQDTQGEQIDASTILYPNAFDGPITASVRYSCKLSGMEQDIILATQIDPADWGFGDHSVIECWTETFNWPEPQNIELTQAGDMDDIRLKWPEFQIGQGKAFAVDGDGTEVKISKRYGPVNGRKFLVEIVQAKKLAPMMENLPPPVQEARNARKVRTQEELLAMAKPKRDKNQSASVKRTKRELVAGVVLDYSTLTSQPGAYTFEGNMCYLATSEVTFTGTATLMGGTVIKLDSGGKLKFLGDVVCKTTPYQPAIVTSRLDGSVGEFITAGPPTSKIYGAPAINLASTTAINYKLHDLAVRWAGEAIRIENGSLTVTNLQVVNCGTGIYRGSGATTLALKNALFDDVGVFMDGTSGGGNTGEHLTVHRVGNFMQGVVSPIALKNTLLISTTNTSGKCSPGSTVVDQLDDTGVFAAQVGVGRHYLAGNSPYRNIGETITDAQLLKELKGRTTYPPVAISGSTAFATLDPRTTPDQGPLDYGYHYALADFVCSDVALGANLTLTNGVVVLGAGTSAFKVGYTQIFNTEGTPTRLNRIVWCNSVQEQPISSGAAPGSRNLIEVTGNLSPAPTIRMRFTETCVGAGEGYVIYCGNAYGTYNPGLLEIRDSQIRGGLLYLSPSVVGMNPYFINSLLENTALNINQGTVYATQPFAWTVRNCLFRGGTINLTKNTTSQTWMFKANLFDPSSLSVTLGSGVTLNASHNGYRTGATRLPGETSYQLVTTFNFMTGDLGDYYYTLPAAAGTLNNLVDTGDMTAASAGLYFETVNGAAMVKDGGTTVDIGRHYVALVNGSPADTDGDCTPDYAEDANQNGIVDAGETSCTAYNSPNGIGSGPSLIRFTPLR